MHASSAEIFIYLSRIMHMRHYIWLCSALCPPNVPIYVPCILSIYAISKLRCAFCQLPNCLPISKLHKQFANCATWLLRILEMEVKQLQSLQVAITHLHLLNTWRGKYRIDYEGQQQWMPASRTLIVHALKSIVRQVQYRCRWRSRDDQTLY